MYSVYGGVQHHRSRARYATVVAVLVVTVLLLGAVHSGIAAHFGVLGTKKSAALPQSAPVSAPKKLSEPVLAPLPPAGSSVSTKVTQAVNDALSHNNSATWSVAVYDIANKQWLTQINADQQMSTASLYKLYTVYALSKTMPVSEWSSATVADQSVTSCVDRMLRLSDNTCGEAVAKMVGWGTIDRYAHAYGFNKTFTNLQSGPITTANDTTLFMSDLYQTKLFDVSTTSSLLDSLHHQIFRRGIPAGCSGCTVYDKTGNDSNVTHDAAIVTSGDSTYAVTIMSQHGSSAGIARIEQAVQAGLQQ